MLDILNIDIIEKIYNYLDINDKFNFILCNKTCYKLNNNIQKYKLIFYLNNDYENFYKYLNEYNYENEIRFINKIIGRTFINIPRIKPTRIIEMYDLRFIFELLYNGYCPTKDEIKRLNIHFYIHFYSKIKDSIILNNRKLTIDNIEKDAYLFSLKQEPKIKEEIKKEINWISIHKE